MLVVLLLLFVSLMGMLTSCLLLGAVAQLEAKKEEIRQLEMDKLVLRDEVLTWQDDFSEVLAKYLQAKTVMSNYHDDLVATEADLETAHAQLQDLSDGYAALAHIYLTEECATCGLEGFRRGKWLV